MFNTLTKRKIWVKMKVKYDIGDSGQSVRRQEQIRRRRGYNRVE
jgi:hypothetical protein